MEELARALLGGAVGMMIFIAVFIGLDLWIYGWKNKDD